MVAVREGTGEAMAAEMSVWLAIGPPLVMAAIVMVGMAVTAPSEMGMVEATAATAVAIGPIVMAMVVTALSTARARPPRTIPPLLPPPRRRVRSGGRACSCPSAPWLILSEGVRW